MLLFEMLYNCIWKGLSSYCQNAYLYLRIHRKWWMRSKGCSHNMNAAVPVCIVFCYVSHVINRGSFITMVKFLTFVEIFFEMHMASTVVISDDNVCKDAGGNNNKVCLWMTYLFVHVQHIWLCVSWDDNTVPDQHFLSNKSHNPLSIIVIFNYDEWCKWFILWVENRLIWIYYTTKIKVCIKNSIY